MKRDPEQVCKVKLPTGQYLCFMSYSASPDGVEDVWFEDEDGNELLYYYYTEWQEEPQFVMACILAAIQNGAKDTKQNEITH